MSLKSFHIVFIFLSILISFGFGCWGLRAENSADRTIFYSALLSLAVGLSLLIYLPWFIRKVKASSA